MVEYTTQASWVLIAAVVLSLLYEFYRATTKSEVSTWDSKRAFLTQAIPVYVAVIIIAGLLQTGWLWVVWVTLAYTVAMNLFGIFYYSPVILPSRKPGPIDHFEDKVYTGLHFVVAALLIYHLFGTKLSP